jgi:hypothetical protein
MVQSHCSFDGFMRGALCGAQLGLLVLAQLHSAGAARQRRDGRFPVDGEVLLRVRARWWEAPQVPGLGGGGVF